MTKYPCPVCHRRICDSEKILYLTQERAEASPAADVVIKCQNCKNTISIQVSDVIDYLIPKERATIQ